MSTHIQSQQVNTHKGMGVYYLYISTSLLFTILTLLQSPSCFEHRKEILLKVAVSDFIILQFNYLFSLSFFNNHPPLSFYSSWFCSWPHSAKTHFFPARIHVPIFTWLTSCLPDGASVPFADFSFLFLLLNCRQPSFFWPLSHFSLLSCLLWFKVSGSFLFSTA